MIQNMSKPRRASTDISRWLMEELAGGGFAVILLMDDWISYSFKIRLEALQEQNRSGSLPRKAGAVAPIVLLGIWQHA